MKKHEINPYIDIKGLFGWNKKYYSKNRRNIPWIRTWEVIIKLKRGMISFDFFEDPYTAKLVFDLVQKELNKQEV